MDRRSPMTVRGWSHGRLTWKAFALALVLGFLGSSLPAVLANDETPRVPGGGTLGYGPPGVFDGFQGFGLGYHLGYRYGGDALGVGAEGGYPFYGGPGYPHKEPRLRRLGRIVPFCYFGGPGYPTPDHPNFFGGFGPLVPDQ